MNRSIKAQITRLTLLSTITVFAAVVIALVLFWGSKKSYLMNSAANAILANTKHDMNRLIPAFILPEQRLALPILVEKIRQEMHLDKVLIYQTLQEIPEAYIECLPKTSELIPCERWWSDEVLVISKIQEGASEFGYLFRSKVVDYSSASSQLFTTLEFIAFALALFFLITYKGITKLTAKDVPRAMDDLVIWIESVIGAQQKPKPNFTFDEFNQLANKIQEVVSHQLRLQEEAKLVGFSKQVAHDIRSPLSALNMVSSSLTEVPEAKRLLIRNAIQRINDIANDLLAKGKHSAELQSEGQPFSGLTANFKGKNEIILLPALVDSLVSEKRIQFRDQINVRIESDFKNSFGAFVVADGKELMRLVSNLINNAVEAFANQTGEVVVAVRAYKDIIHLSLRDNGRGIPPDILQRLGEAGVTYGKDGTQSGSGLGVYHAKKSVEASGGQFKISSQVGVGTMIDIHLPRVAAPAWFLDAIILKPGMEIMSLDDDLTIHGIWRGRLDSLQTSQKNFGMRNFTSANDFKSVVKSLPISELGRKVFLVDYELLGQATTGLDVIEEIGLQQNVVLVTSRYEEPEIQRRCEDLKIKLLPKSLAGFVPIRIDTPKEKYDWVLIDDDELSHMTWKMAASENNKKFVGFKSPEGLASFMKNIDPLSAIYIDSNLGNGIKGEELAKQLYAEGCSNLYLATGYAADQFPPMDFIKAVVGKEPPL